MNIIYLKMDQVLKIFNENIFLFLPRVFLEGFNEINKTILKENLEKSKKFYVELFQISHI